MNAFLTPSDTLHKQRRNAIIMSEASVVGLTLVGLNQLWYADYEKSKFHTLDDNAEWLQMDKFGHVFTSYQMGRAGAELLNWSGVREKDQLLYGATLGFGFLTAVEILDGYSKEWGFSWGDVLANASGTGLYIGQELLWKEQRISLKYSFHRTKYAKQRPDKLGEGFLEEILKDYNGQTYWLSANLHSFVKNEKIPKWLNIALGCGADGMLTGISEPIDGMSSPQQRARQYYLSLDVDFTRIKTNSHLLKSVFSILNVLKVPFPTLEFHDESGFKFHPIYF
ncbi:MAG: DUF2279 domain-containing protein [Oceanihabitans sediminis]|uniref:DUF2279 domain-containing protein n=2 Tax=Oceanihabitans sediminis TaxID=1812012 RepID=A0A368P5Q2_9FLAO|nr:DUF2279 domain-containing protein [Oceanihabitans sediminis]MDX1277768.1 DUF2279 domain-containing protein [Oceanihabitans sediminis]MDX1774816.1 DUF2279 domain-containing protein [Oceanihabitans sediminis]RCU57773.1 DUF2279 domain-containing protein [Oceanihabitans sediminis]